MQQESTVPGIWQGPQEVHKHILNIHKFDEIPTDYVMAKLNENQREAIANFYALGLWCRDICLRSLKGPNWKWVKEADEGKGAWVNLPYTEEEKQEIINNANGCLRAYTLHNDWMATLHRNVEKNPLPELIVTQAKQESNDGLTILNKAMNKKDEQHVGVQ